MSVPAVAGVFLATQGGANQAIANRYELRHSQKGEGAANKSPQRFLLRLFRTLRNRFEQITNHKTQAHRA